MKVPIEWLKEYVDFEATPEEVAEKLTFSGVEVEGIETIGSDYQGMVAGKVLSIESHPNADRLRLCRISDGTNELQVVCGADNFDVGDKAALAPVGVKLRDGTKIKRSKIRGVESEGMLCAEDELGLSSDHSGIMLLPADVAEGTPLSEVLGTPETVLDLEITWNRPDCLSIIGIAREIAALFGSSLKMPEVVLPEAGSPVETMARVTVEAMEGCPRYTARVLTGLQPGPSPMWLQKRLRLCGIRPIGNIVDITNYVMLECGHPLHAFDYELLRDHHIVVRRARPGEKMSTLDGIERDITPDMLMIADTTQPVAVAGVMGGAGSEIRDVTTDVLLESACFSPPGIRNTSSALGLQTESSHRFERGVNVEGVEWASRRAAALMVEIAGAACAQGVIDVYPVKPEERRVTCRYRRTRDLLGVDVPDEEIVGILESLELPVESTTDASCTVRVPVFRGDLQIEADLIEEVARIHGLEQVPAATPNAAVVPDVDDAATRSWLRCRVNLVGLGLTEIVNYSYLSEQLLDTFSTEDCETRVPLLNPVSTEYAVLRNSLIPQMVDCLGGNLAHQTSTAACFEMGRVFIKQGGGTIAEEERLCVGLMGSVGRHGVHGHQPVTPEEAFVWLKGIVEALLRAQGLGGMQVTALSRPYYEDGWAAIVTCGETKIGELGLLSAGIRRKWRMAEPIPVAELQLAPLLEEVSSIRDVRPLSPYPSVSRDVALIVKSSVTHADILRVMGASAPPELTDIRLFDIFLSEGIGEGLKSLAYSLTYRSQEQNLTDEVVNGYHELVREALREELGAELRET